MMSPQSGQQAGPVYRLHPDVVRLTRPDGSSHLMHMSGNVCAIDPQATDWLMSIIAVGPARTASDLASRHGIDETQARADVQAFLGDLCKQKLLQQVQPHRALLARVRDTSAPVLVRAVLRCVDRAKRPLRSRIRGLLWTARWAVAQFGWARAVRAWEAVYPQPRGDGTPPVAMLDAMDQAVREAAARSLLPVECKERAFTCLALARTSGLVADLVVGMTHHPLQGHVWVEVQGRVISDHPEHCRGFEVVARYG